MINDVLYKNVEKLDDQFIKYSRDALLNKYVPLVKNIIMSDYDKLLVGAVVDKRSRTNPLFYRQEFYKALNLFKFLKIGDTYTTFVVPDENNFPFNTGRLPIIKNILEGISGIYVEVDEEQYVKLFGRRPINTEPYDKTVPPKERIYLLRYTGDVQRREVNVFRRQVLVRYPFSNSPPIRLFDNALKFVKSNYTTWLTDICENATRMFVKGEFTYDELRDEKIT